MKDLIKALLILEHYTDDRYPTGCEHNTLYVYVDPASVSPEDIARLAELGFVPSSDDPCFVSYRFGSA